MLFNNFSQADPDFQEMKGKWQNYQSEDPQAKNCLLYTSDAADD